MNPDNGERRTTNFAWVAGLITGLPLAVLVGGFAGWAAGGAAGEWLEYLGATEAVARGGRLGGVLGAVLCAASVAHRLRRDERPAADAATDRRDTPAP